MIEEKMTTLITYLSNLIGQPLCCIFLWDTHCLLLFYGIWFALIENGKSEYVIEIVFPDRPVAA